MDSQQLIEKLSFQVDSFQEGFKILSESRNLNELAKSFCHIPRGSLMVSYVNLYFKSSDEEEFSTVGIALALTIIALGVAIIKKKNQ